MSSVRKFELFFYTLAILQMCVITYLCKQLNENGFNSSDLGYAYRAGCLVGSTRAGNPKHKMCTDAGKMYKQRMEMPFGESQKDTR